jgi:tetratricopeptide (TPR) repeat protein
MKAAGQKMTNSAPNPGPDSPRILPSTSFRWRVGLGLLFLVGLAGWYGYQRERNAWVKSHLRAAHDALDFRDYAQALANLEICLDYQPNDPEFHFLAARTLRRAALLGSGEADWDSRAIRQLSTCEKLKYPPEDIALEKTLLRAMGADFDRAETELLTLLVRKHPDSALILETLVPLYLLHYQVPRALISVTQLLNEQPDDAYAYYWRGMARDQLQSSHQAIEDYMHALQLKPDLDEARMLLALDLLSLQHYEEARRHFEVAMARQADHVAVQLGIARCLHGLGRLEEARQRLDHLLAAQPREGLALAERGKVALEQGNSQEAETFLRAALALMPHHSQTTYALYQCLLQQGKKDEAATYRAQFGVIEADAKRYRKITELMSQSPHDVDLRYQAGLILLRQDQKRQGVGWLTSALQIAPLHPGAHGALADYYTEVGQKARAAYHRRLATEGMIGVIEDLSIHLY